MWPLKYSLFTEQLGFWTGPGRAGVNKLTRMSCDSTLRHEPTHRPTSMNPFSSTFFEVIIDPISKSTPFIISACWNLIKCGTLWHGWLQVPLLATDLSLLFAALDAIRSNQNGPETRLEDDRLEDRLLSPRRIKLGRKLPKPLAIANRYVPRRVEWRFIIVFDEKTDLWKWLGSTEFIFTLKLVE